MKLENDNQFSFLKFLYKLYNIITIKLEYFNRYEWITNSAFFDVLKDGFQTLCIQKSGTYKFELIAPGRSSEYSGARVCGSVNLKQGRDETEILLLRATLLIIKFFYSGSSLCNLLYCNLLNRNISFKVKK